MQIAMIQDKIVPLEELEAVYQDRGTFFGDGVYETIRSYDGKIFALEEHLERFSHSLAAIKIEGIGIDEVRERVQKAFDAAGIADARIYFHVTRGSELREHSWGSDIEPRFFLIITELGDNSKMKSEGIAVSTEPDLRWKRCDIKSLNLLPNVMAKQAAVKKNCQEAILVDENGLITEGAGSAFFGIIGKTLRTAPLTANILPSVTRKFTIQAGKNIGLEIVEESLTPDEAANADELFMAVTTKDIVGIVKFDNKVISDGRPGKFTKLLAKEFCSFQK